MGIELEGYVEGAVFVVTLSPAWAPLIWGAHHQQQHDTGPAAAASGGSRGRGREGTGRVLVVEYKGYRRWRVGDEGGAIGRRLRDGRADGVVCAWPD